MLSNLVTSNRHSVGLHNLVGFHKVTDLHARIDFIQYANMLLVTGNLVTSNGHCMELYNSVGYHKVNDLLA